jgi:hypothetical protein
VISGGALYLAVSFAGVQLFPGAGHAHPGPLRGLVYLIATVSGVYAFAAATHWRRRDATGADPGEPST